MIEPKIKTMYIALKIGKLDFKDFFSYSLDLLSSSIAVSPSSSYCLMRFVYCLPISKVATKPTIEIIVNSVMIKVIFILCLPRILIHPFLSISYFST